MSAEGGSAEMEFAWDPVKAASNLAKHGLAFAQAANVFADALALTVFDEAHSEFDERWFTLGMDSAGKLLAVSHTYTPTGPASARVRIISAREATRSERRQYQDGPALSGYRSSSQRVMTMGTRADPHGSSNGDDMPAEIDFSKGTRGKFFRAGARISLPVYLEAEVQDYLAARAKARGIEVGQLVKELLKKNIELIEVAR